MPERRRASEALWSGDPDLSKPGGPKTKPHKSENGSQCKPLASRPNYGDCRGAVRVEDRISPGANPFPLAGEGGPKGRMRGIERSEMALNVRHVSRSLDALGLCVIS
jgi:hypothetical protein